ncbi:PQQ-dependent sugar dehydrogenase [Microbacterium sp. HD4P20]|nr:PQQ-dependent sugar dehydrogenase [Microbacterium sp. HD4P20]MCP2636802.1 PQQ-dependent sugar dehydrogenase [Microbacterium sp. HD4P20]
MASGCTSVPLSPAPPSISATAAPAPTASDPAQWWRATDDVATLAAGLQAPWSVVPLAEGGALISQRDDGQILELAPGGALRAVGTVPGVVSGGESGLHGLALFARDGEMLLYAYFGAADDNRVIRMALLGEPGSLMLGEPETILTGIPRANTHNGGRIAFGPDGHLYITTGDAQRRDASQDPEALGGKILRVTPDGDPAPGNPWGNAVYSLGHRNVQGIAWTADGTLWASEFGQNTWDELNRIEAGGNYGWPLVEGEGGAPEFIDPVAVWATSEASPSGIAARDATVFIAGLRGERLWMLDTRGGAAAAEPVAALAGQQGRLRDAVVAPDGSLWILTNNTDGRGSPRPEDDLLLRVELAPAE